MRNKKGKKNKQINILFYVPPLITNGDPFFFEGAVKNKLLPLAMLCGEIGHRVTLTLPSSIVSNIIIPTKINTQAVDNTDFISRTNIFSDFDKHLYQNNNIKLTELAAGYYSEIITDIPDVIFVWESCSYHLQKAFPDAVIIHLMPGFLSRLPYPELVYFDTIGLFKDSQIYQNIMEDIDTYPLFDEELRILKQLELSILDFFESQKNYRDLVANIPNYNDFSSHVLLPLQYSKHYNFQKDSEYNDQTELLYDVLETTDKTKGIIVTQYIANSIAESALDPNHINYLEENYPNFLFDENFNRIDNISQYLLSYVDEIVTCSSSIGLQGILLNKKVTVLGDTFLSKIVKFAQESEINRKKVLCYLLFQRCVSAAKLFDKEFLSKFVSKVHRNHHTNAKNFSLRSIDPNYGNFLLSNMRTKRAEEKLSAILPKNDPYFLPENVLKKIENAEIVSFDIFETLVERPFTQPIDVFTLIERRLKETNIPFFEFSKARVEAERIAKELLPAKTEEVTLDQIYDILAVQFAISKKNIVTLKNLELDTEFKLLTVRPIGKYIYDLCKNKNKKIIFTSDMYLDINFLKSVLEKNNYEVNENLYVSSKLKIKKRTGNLFKHILDKEKIKASLLLHFGDNSVGDEKIPISLGIQAVRLTRSVDKMFNHPHYKNIFTIRGNWNRTLHESVVTYMVARRLFDNPFVNHFHDCYFNSSAIELGYAALGPCITDYAFWLESEIKKNNNDSVYFIARDGKIIKEVYDVLFDSQDVKTHYMFGSRRMMRHTNIPSLADIYSAIGKLKGINVAKSLEKLFGWQTSNPSLTKVIQTEKEELEAMQEIVQELPNFHQQSACQYLILKEYSDSLNFSQSKKPCIVEIGYAGTIQDYLQKTLNVDIDGYYFILFDTAINRISDKCKMSGYTGHLIERTHHWHSISNNGFMYETLFCSDEDTIICLKKSKHGVSCVREKNPLDAQRKHLIRQVHAGARAYSRDFYQLISQFFEYLDINPEMGSRVINGFLENPGKSDAKLFEGIIFSSNFAESSYRYIIPPAELKNKYLNNELLTVWKNGCDVFFDGEDENNEISSAKSEQKVVMRVNEKKGKQNYLENKLVGKLEKKIVHFLTKNNVNKRKKYETNPNSYFYDIKSPAGKLYGYLRKIL